MITKSIYELESKANTVFTGFGYSESAIRGKCLEVRRHIKFHIERGVEQFDKNLVDEYVKSQEARYQTGKIGRGLLLMRIKTAEHLIQIHETGTVVNKHHSNLPELPHGFNEILSDILANNEWNTKFKKLQHNRTGTFFRWLNSRGHSDLRQVDENVVRDYLVDCSTRVVGKSLNEIIRSLKNLFLFISETGELSEQMNRLFLFKARVDNKIEPFMPQNEIAAVLNVIDRNTMQGKWKN